MSATYFECHGCGKECSQAYATHDGYPYHFVCLPRKPTKLQFTNDWLKTKIEQDGDEEP